MRPLDWCPDEALVERLTRGHTWDCGWQRNAGRDCDCGHEEVIARLRYIVHAYAEVR